MANACVRTAAACSFSLPLLPPIAAPSSSPTLHMDSAPDPSQASTFFTGQFGGGGGVVQYPGKPVSSQLLSLAYFYICSFILGSKLSRCRKHLCPHLCPHPCPCCLMMNQNSNLLSKLLKSQSRARRSPRLNLCKLVQ